MSEAGILFLTTVVAILIFKTLVLCSGVLVIYFGKDLLEKGISGGFKFKSKIGNDVAFDLVSASPGLFFILMGSLMIGLGIFVDKSVMLDVPGAAIERPGFPEPLPTESGDE